MLELVGVTTLLDSLRCVSEGGVVCMTGIVGNKWTMESFEPMGDIPTAVNLTTYAGGPNEFMETPMEELAERVADGRLKLPVRQAYSLKKTYKILETNLAAVQIARGFGIASRATVSVGFEGTEGVRQSSEDICEAFNKTLLPDADVSVLSP